MTDSVVVTPQNKGQIMLPKKWRDALDAQAFHAVFDGKSIVMTPLYPSQELEVQEYSTDNEEGLIFPNGVGHEEFVQALKKIDG